MQIEQHLFLLQDGAQFGIRYAICVLSVRECQHSRRACRLTAERTAGNDARDLPALARGTDDAPRREKVGIIGMVQRFVRNGIMRAALAEIGDHTDGIIAKHTVLRSLKGALSNNVAHRAELRHFGQHHDLARVRINPLVFLKQQLLAAQNELRDLLGAVSMEELQPLRMSVSVCRRAGMVPMTEGCKILICNVFLCTLIGKIVHPIA